MNWPQFLIEELADRRCALFIGSGLSSSCQTESGQRPPSWSDLLADMIDFVRDDSVKAIVGNLIENQSYLEAAEIIAENSSDEDRSRLLKQKLDKPFTHSRWLEICVELDQPIIITTNYDCIIEDGVSNQGYAVRTFKNKNAVKVLRTPQILIYKIHGCVRMDPDDIILTMSDYHKIQKESPYCLKMLEAICTTHTVLFLGYSMSDPDINLVFQNARINFPESIKHIILTQETDSPEIRKAKERIFGLESCLYPTDQHEKGLEMLEDLLQSVTAWRASK